MSSIVLTLGNTSDYTSGVQFRVLPKEERRRKLHDERLLAFVAGASSIHVILSLLMRWMPWVHERSGAPTIISSLFAAGGALLILHRQRRRRATMPAPPSVSELTNTQYWSWVDLLLGLAALAGVVLVVVDVTRLIGISF